jgi:glycosyltransferase involved in cell wall biosynthesis
MPVVGRGATESRRVRVAYVIAGLELGGAERQLVRLVNGLDRERYQPVVITWARRGRLHSELAGDVLTVDLGLVEDTHRSLAIRGLTAARLTVALAGALGELRPRLAHAYMFQSYVATALAARGAKVVAGRRNLKTRADMPRLASWVGRLANRRIDLHICNSEAARRAALDAEPELDPARVVVIPNGLAALERRPLPADIEAWMRPGHVRAAMIGGLKAVKRQEVALEALAASRVEALQLVIFGEGPLRDKLEGRARELGVADRVFFAGARPEAPSLLANFDFLIHTSSSESSPNTVLEAMAAGLPVLATEVGGVPELAVEGETALLARTPDAVPELLVRLSGDAELRARLGHSAGARAQHFSEQAMVRATEAEYERLLDQEAVTAAETSAA